jgi:hypothetical protein
MRRIGRNNGWIEDLLPQLESPQARIRLSASKALRDLSRDTPEALYSHFDIFAALFDHDHNVLKWNAILTLAHLAPVDRQGKLDRLLPRYLAPIVGPAMITAANAIKGAALIARAKSNLAPKIASSIMRVEKGNYATPECRNVAIGHALQALDTMGSVLKDQRLLRSFAARQTTNPRPSTARKAARLLASLESASKSRNRSS